MYLRLLFFCQSSNFFNSLVVKVIERRVFNALRSINI